MKKLKPNKKKCDEIFSRIIRKAGKCYKCGSTYRNQCAHIISRSYYTVRWNLENAICLCSKCHIYYTYRPLQWEDYIKGEIGEEKYQALRNRALTYEKIDYDAIYNDLVGQEELF